MRAAVLDLGSNSFHLLVADVDGRTVVPQRRSREMLHLGRALALHGRIAPDLHLRAVATVERLADLARRSGAEHLSAVGTAALREPASAELLADLNRAVGPERDLSITLLDGTEEARLAYLGARAAVGIEVEPALVLDLGGGSLELAVGRGDRVLWSASLPLGASRLSARLSDGAAKDEVGSLRAHVDELLRPAIDVVDRHQPAAILLVGGTVRALARLLAVQAGRWLPSTVNRAPIGTAALAAVRDQLLAVDLTGRRGIDGVKERRADHLHVAALVLHRALELLDIEEALVSDWGLREGLLLHRHGQPTAGGSDELQQREVTRLRTAFGCDDPHPTHVARLATRLFDATHAIHGLDGDARRLLEHAAQLHSIGSTLALRRQQEHGAYLIEHAELRGFGPRELAIIVTLVRFHPSRGISRRFPPHAGLSAADRAMTATLLSLLKLADALDTGHDQRIELETVRRRGALLELVISGDPVTRSDGLGAITRAVRDRSSFVEETLGLGVTLAVRAAA
jgi:exopolyphosphatase / guanosine-5'-triphosphate,3'-diphosphate pyrophosphatase